jgi:hypothetical protein
MSTGGLESGFFVSCPLFAHFWSNQRVKGTCSLRSLVFFVVKRAVINRTASIDTKQFFNLGRKDGRLMVSTERGDAQEVLISQEI